MTVKACTCTHEYQDKMYGKGQRVHTEGGKCTVCGADNVKGTAGKRK